MLQADTYVFNVTPFVDYLPKIVTVCAPENIRYDVEWAAREWNSAIKQYSSIVGEPWLNEPAIHVVETNCFAKIHLTQTPVSPTEYGRVELALNRTTFRIEGLNVFVWNTTDRGLFRAILIHELGHALGAPDIYVYGSNSKKPIMAHVLTSIPEKIEITFIDVYLIHMTKVKRLECLGTRCSAYSVRLPNDPLSQTLAMLAPPLTAGVLTYLLPLLAPLVRRWYTRAVG
ncbi:MAG: hypothetical protein QXI60_04740 [Thermofilaceae archaeon]